MSSVPPDELRRCSAKWRVVWAMVMFCIDGATVGLATFVVLTTESLWCLSATAEFRGWVLMALVLSVWGVMMTWLRYTRDGCSDRCVPCTTFFLWVTVAFSILATALAVDCLRRLPLNHHCPGTCLAASPNCTDETGQEVEQGRGRLPAATVAMLALQLLKVLIILLADSRRPFFATLCHHECCASIHMSAVVVQTPPETKPTLGPFPKLCVRSPTGDGYPVAVSDLDSLQRLVASPTGTPGSRSSGRVSIASSPTDTPIRSGRVSITSTPLHNSRSSIALYNGRPSPTNGPIHNRPPSIDMLSLGARPPPFDTLSLGGRTETGRPLPTAADAFGGGRPSPTAADAHVLGAVFGGGRGGRTTGASRTFLYAQAAAAQAALVARPFLPSPKRGGGRPPLFSGVGGGGGGSGGGGGGCGVVPSPTHTPVRSSSRTPEWARVASPTGGPATSSGALVLSPTESSETSSTSSRNSVILATLRAQFANSAYGSKSLLRQLGGRELAGSSPHDGHGSLPSQVPVSSTPLHTDLPLAPTLPPLPCPIVRELLRHVR